MRPQETRHIPELDGLRAIAVVSVMVHHLWTPLPSPFGVWGVRLFFVISGYLITGLLLNAGDSAVRQVDGRLGALKRFYIRRSLRILPLYYLVILVCSIVAFSKVRALLPWLLTYTLNFRIAGQGYYDEYFAHFWSLSVEEQFYIVWPWIVLGAPRRRLVWISLSLLLVAGGFRAQYMLSNLTSTTAVGTYVLPWAAFDSLGVGALLSIFSRTLEPSRLDRLLFYGSLLASLVLLILWLGGQPILGWPRFFLDDGLTSIVFATIIRGVARGQSRVSALLRSGPLAYIGKISYGLYVYHPFMFLLTQWLGWWSKPGFAPFVVDSALTLGIASLSWYAFEAPVNSLKRYFRDPSPEQIGGSISSEARRAG